MTLAARDITFSYTRRGPVLSGVCAEFAPGTVTALVGPNGAGKSTLLRLLAGLASPASGEVTLAGAHVASMPDTARARRLAYLAQRPSLAFDYTVDRVVRFGAYAAAAPPNGSADRWLERVGLAERAHDLFTHLSVGQQQLASLARALVQLDAADSDHPVLLADEPMSAMDPAHALRTTELLRERAQAGTIVVLVVHDLTQAAGVADRAVVLSRAGSVHAAGDAAGVLTPETLAPAFGVPFAKITAGGLSALVPRRENAREPAAETLPEPGAGPSPDRPM